MTKQALVLAAGQGSRLKDCTKQKAIHCIDDVPLLGWVLQGLKLAGIENVVIVVGYEGENIQQEFGQNYLGLDIDYVVAENWKKGNLYSFLAAKHKFKGSFVLCMGDHLFDSQIVKKLITFDQKCSIVLAIDRVGYAVDDTKILEQDGILVKIGTDISPSNGVNTGFFLCSPKMFSYADEVAKNGKSEMDDCIRVAAASKDTQILDVSGYYWVDVDTKTDLERAKKVLAKHLRTKK
jgi:choline kinase